MSRLDLALRWADRRWTRIGLVMAPSVLFAMAWMLRILSPTWWLADAVKRGRKGARRTKAIWRFNRAYLTIALLLSVAVIAGTSLSHLQADGLWSWRLPAGWFLLSRCTEVFVAFLRDAADKLSPSGRSGSDLSPAQRVNLALASYAEIILDFALLYAFLSQTMWQCDHRPTGFGDLLTYSASTITTSGGGGLQASHWLSQSLTTFEIVTGIVLLVVCFAVYVGGASEGRAKRRRVLRPAERLLRRRRGALTRSSHL